VSEIVNESKQKMLLRDIPLLLTKYRITVDEFKQFEGVVTKVMERVLKKQ
jgi:hypothetical protein